MKCAVTTGSVSGELCLADNRRRYGTYELTMIKKDVFELRHPRKAICPRCKVQHLTSIPRGDTDDLCDACEEAWITSEEYQMLLRSLK